MPNLQKPKVTIGRVEHVSLPHFGISDIPARIDTGAQTSAIWVSQAKIVDGKLEVVLFDKNHPAYTGEVLKFDQFTETVVASSNGQSETRFKIRTLLMIAGRKIRARLTLADRSTQVYPILIGRNVLRGKFIVDVKLGTPNKILEKSRSKQLQAQLKSRSAKS